MKYIATISLIFMLCSFGGCEKVPSAGARGPIWVTFMSSPGGLVDNQINCIHVDNQGTVWLGTNQGASGYHNGVWYHLIDSLRYIVGRISIKDTEGTSYDSVIYGAEVTSIAVAQDGSLLFGLNGGGISRYDQFPPIGTGMNYIWSRFLEPSLAGNYVYSIVTEHVGSGEVWISSANAGLTQFIPFPDSTSFGAGAWMNYTAANGDFKWSDVTAIAEDSIDNSIWIGINYYGVTTYETENNQWGLAYRLPNSLSLKVTSIAIDRSELVWVGTSNGVAVFDKSAAKWTAFYSADSNAEAFALPYVYAVTTDAGVSRWFGTDAGLIELFDSRLFLFNQTNSPLPSVHIRALSYDQKGNLWIGTTNGVAVYNPMGTSL
jgi:ligand-binding sensor domain-containing protein